MTDMFSRLAGWMVGLLRGLDRATAVMRAPEQRVRHSSPGMPEKFG